jgi:hypothetical protein
MIVVPREAEFAMPASEARLHHHAIADGEILDALSDGNHFAGRFMSQDLRKRGRKIAHAAILIPVQIAAANPDGSNTHGDLAMPRISRLRHLALF